MLEIRDISPEKVKLYGKQFLKLIKEAHRGYEEMMQDQYENRPRDPNHQNVIDLISDDEAEDGDELDDFEVDDESQEQRSHFFQPAAEVDSFNATLQSLAPAAPSARAQSARAQSTSADSKGRSGGKGGRSTFKGRGGYSKGRRKASGGSSKGKAPASITKSKSMSSGSSGSSFGLGAPKRGDGGGGFANGGIGMMPI